MIDARWNNDRITAREEYEEYVRLYGEKEALDRIEKSLRMIGGREHYEWDAAGINMSHLSFEERFMRMEYAKRMLRKRDGYLEILVGH